MKMSTPYYDMELSDDYDENNERTDANAHGGELTTLLSDARAVDALLHDLEGDIEGSVYQIIVLFLAYLGYPAEGEGLEFDLELYTPTVRSLCRITYVLRGAQGAVREAVYKAVINYIVDGQLHDDEGNDAEEDGPVCDCMEEVTDGEDKEETTIHETGTTSSAREQSRL